MRQTFFFCSILSHLLNDGHDPLNQYHGPLMGCNCSLKTLSLKTLYIPSKSIKECIFCHPFESIKYLFTLKWKKHMMNYLGIWTHLFYLLDLTLKILIVMLTLYLKNIKKYHAIILKYMKSFLAAFVCFVDNLNSFIEVKLTHNKLHICKMYSLICFDMLHTWTHHNSQDNEVGGTPKASLSFFVFLLCHLSFTWQPLYFFCHNALVCVS